jgi:hypothetical protein
MDFLKKNWFVIFLIIAVVFTVRTCDDPDLKKKIQELEKKNDSIKASIAIKNEKIIFLNKAIDSTKLKIDSLSKVKQKIIIKRVEVAQQVDTFTDSELDSIINSVPKKLAVKSILDYPLVLNELDITNKLVITYKKEVFHLEQRDSLRVGIIKDKDAQILNVENQRDLYEKETKKSTAFLYLEIPLQKNPIKYEAGIDYVIKNKLLIGISAEYNTLVEKGSINGKLGMKIF